MSDPQADSDADARALAAVRERYARFAGEAVGRSEVYREWADGIVGDSAVQRVIARVPENRRQAPLVFAVDELVTETSRRSLQTNEPQRAAVLLPALAEISGPLAVIEVGASAGLCLIPDRYSYRYRGAADIALGTGEPVLHTELRGACAPTSVNAMPEITWRAGIDLAPLSSANPADRAFLTALVWPGEEGREARITAALDAAASDPPRIVAGDATEPGVLAALAADARGSAPAATLVVMTPGVLPHIPRAGCDKLAGEIRALGAVWISIEPAGTFGPSPGIPAGAFVLRRDDEVLAVCDPLGSWVEWRR